MDTINKLLDELTVKKVSFNDIVEINNIESNNVKNNNIEDQDEIYDYEPVEEETTKYVDCMNICHIYFKNLFNKNNENMFSNVNDKDEYSTNKEMEFVYETIYKYNINLANNTKLCDIYDPTKINNYLNKDDYNELYGLLSNNQIIKVCPSLFGIVTYIAHHVNWKNEDVEWAIIPLMD